jgi:hypothetical protein
VIRRHVLAALATGVEAGDDDAARAATARTDWVLRGSVRRQLERALIDAALVSRALVSSADPEGMRHVQRVAALSLAGRYDIDATDREEVTDAYGRLAAPAPPAAPVATIAVVAAGVIALGLFVWLVIALRTPHRMVRPDAPLPSGAYLTGGAPARDDELEAFLVTELSTLSVESDAERHGSPVSRTRSSHLAALRDAPLIVKRGPGLLRSWREMLDAFDHWVDVPSLSRGFHKAEAELRVRTEAVSDQLAALGLGYHLMTSVMMDRRSAHAGIFVFAVERVAFVRARGEPRRVLELRRLDHLNLRFTVLGMQTEELGDPVVMLDEVEDYVEDRVEPVLETEVYALGDDGWRKSPTARRLEAAAGAMIRHELLLAPERGHDGILRAVTASVRRHEARHGLDRDRNEPLRFPGVLAAHVGPDVGTNHRFVLRARAELSAYLCQIASDPVLPHLALWNLASLAFTRDHWDSAESYVAVVVIEGLARRFGIPARGPVVHDGQLDRNRLAALALPIASYTDDDLRKATRELWQDLYGETFTAIVDQ